MKERIEELIEKVNKEMKEKFENYKQNNNKERILGYQDCYLNLIHIILNCLKEKTNESKRYRRNSKEIQNVKRI